MPFFLVCCGNTSSNIVEIIVNYFWLVFFMACSFFESFGVSYDVLYFLAF